MADNEQKRSSDPHATAEPRSTEHRSFAADVPQSVKKETPRGEFSAAVNVDPEASVVWGTEKQDEVAAPKSAPRIRRLPVDKKFETRRLLVLLCTVIPFTVFAFWPSFSEMVYAWWYQLDYGHGFFVLPLVALFLYYRFDDYPGTRYQLTWLGLFPILICCLMRFFSARMYMTALDQWSIFFWILGVVWFFYGTRVFCWALPSLAFLIFMFQLPWSFEALLRNQLQEIAAQFAAVLLQLLGEPAIPIKNTIRLSNQELAVEMACSGIRFLISILAIASAAILLMRRPWWQNVLIFAVAAPIALFVNAARIAMTGILLVHFESFMQSITPESQSIAARADDIAGFTMIPIAIGLFFAFVWYLGKVFRRVVIQ